jgi:hypothetical protein
MLWSYAVWAWHWHDPMTSVLRIAGWRSPLGTEATAAKWAAIACHRSQLGGLEPVVPAAHLQRLLRPYEIVVPG